MPVGTASDNAGSSSGGGEARGRFGRHAPMVLVAALLGLGAGALLAVILNLSPSATVTQGRLPSTRRPGGSFEPHAASRMAVSPGQKEDRQATESRRPPALVRQFQNIPEPLDERSDPIEAYNGQERNPLWAPRMETALRARFEKHSPASVGLEGVQISVKECRDNTCRIDFTYPASMLQMAAPEGFPFKRFTPLDIYIWKAGRFSTALKNLPPTRLPDGTATETMVVAFKGPAMDPEHYSTWSGTRGAP